MAEIPTTNVEATFSSRDLANSESETTEQLPLETLLALDKIDELAITERDTPDYDNIQVELRGQFRDQGNNRTLQGEEFTTAFNEWTTNLAAQLEDEGVDNQLRQFQEQRALDNYIDSENGSEYVQTNEDKQRQQNRAIRGITRARRLPTDTSREAVIQMLEELAERKDENDLKGKSQ